MRKLIARSVVALLALGVFSSAASAAPIAIGSFAFSVTTLGPQGAPTGGQFNILNLTGPLVFPPDFNVLTQLLFNTLDISVNGGTTHYLQAGMSTTDGFSYDSPIIPLPGSWPMMATLSGFVTPLAITLDGGAQYNVNNGGAIFTANGTLTPNGCSTEPSGQLGSGTGPIPDGDCEVIYIDADRASNVVPEPATMFLLGSGVVGLVARRRARKA